MIGNRFIDLKNLIDNCESNILILEHNYTYNSTLDTELGTTGTISKSNFIIDGNGFWLNGYGQSRIFKISGSNITLNNITFVRGSANNGCGIYSNSENLVITNSLFNDNSYRYSYYLRGGAMYLDNVATIINCSFELNYIYSHGGSNLF